MHSARPLYNCLAKLSGSNIFGRRSLTAWYISLTVSALKIHRIMTRNNKSAPHEKIFVGCLCRKSFSTLLFMHQIPNPCRGRRLDDPMPPSAALFGQQKKARSKLRVTLLFVLSVLFALADAAERDYYAVNAEQHEICADDISDRRNRNVRAEYHHNAEHQPDNIDYHREPIDKVARNVH